MRIENRWFWPTMVAVGGVVLAVALRLPTLDQPLNRDEALYAYVGQRIWQGDLPYRDLMDLKQPFAYVLYAIFDLFGGPKVGVVRVATGVWAGLSAAALGWAVRPALGDRRALLAAVLMVIVGAGTAIEGSDLNTEHVLVLFTALAVGCALRVSTGRPRMAAAAGGLLGIAVITKGIGVVLAPAIAIAVLLAPAPRPARLRRIAAAAAAACVAPLLLAIGFLALGALDDLWLGNVTYPRAYVASGFRFVQFPEGNPAVVVLFLVALAVTGVHLTLARGRSRVGWTLLAWLIGAWAGALIGGRSFAHYFVPMLPAAAACLVLPLAVPVRRGGLVLAGSVLLALGTAAPFALQSYERFGRSGTENAFHQYGRLGAQASTESFAMAAELGRRARPGDRLYVTGAEPGFLWASELAAATRWTLDYALMVLPERYAADIHHDLCERRPQWLIIAVGIPLAPPAQCLAAGYVDVALVGRSLLRRRVGGP